MLKFKLTKNDGKEIQYTYYPEGEENPGVVSYDKETGNYDIVTVSKADQHQIYAMKMFSRLRKYVESGSFKKEGMIAWY